MKTFNLQFLDNDIGKDDSNFLLDRISPSMYGVYKGCPLAFYYKFIAKIQVPEMNLHLLFGSAVHKCIEEMYNGDEDPVRWFDEIFKQEDLDDTIPDNKGKTSLDNYSQYRMLGLDMVKNYLKLHPKLDSIYSLQEGTAELRFRQPVLNPITGEPSRIPLSGVVDKYLDRNAIVEYKTSKSPWKSTEERFKIQSRLYSLWAYTHTGKIPDEVLYFVLLKQFKQTAYDKTVQVIKYHPTKEDLAEAWEELDTVLEKIEHGHFDKPTHDHPFFCDCIKIEKALGLKSWS